MTQLPVYRSRKPLRTSTKPAKSCGDIICAGFPLVRTLFIEGMSNDPAIVTDFRPGWDESGTSVSVSSVFWPALGAVNSIEIPQSTWAGLVSLEPATTREEFSEVQSDFKLISEGYATHEPFTISHTGNSWEHTYGPPSPPDECSPYSMGSVSETFAAYLAFECIGDGDFFTKTDFGGGVISTAAIEAPSGSKDEYCDKNDPLNSVFGNLYNKFIMSGTPGGTIYEADEPPWTPIGFTLELSYHLISFKCSSVAEQGLDSEGHAPIADFCHPIDDDDLRWPNNSWVVRNTSGYKTIKVTYDPDEL